VVQCGAVLECVADVVVWMCCAGAMYFCMRVAVCASVLQGVAGL